ASVGEPPAIEFTDEGKINDETVATLVEDLEKLAINPECSLYQPTSSQAIKTVAPDSAPELWEAVRIEGKVSQFLQMPRPDNGLAQAIVESYKLAEKAETRRRLLSICASKVTYSELIAHIPKLTRYEFTAARRRTLTLSSGEKINIPNVIRTMLPSHLIRQYNQYCSEEDFIPLSTRTLFRILSEACVASVRKSLQGLDSYAAEGGRGFDDLISLLDTLMQYGANDPEIHKLKESLKHLIQYIKSDYKSLDLVKSFIQSTNLPEDVQDDALFTARTACDAVLSWKSHQLRMVHQDVARSDAIHANQARRFHANQARLCHEVLTSSVQRDTDRILREKRDFVAPYSLPKQQRRRDGRPN
ncbi:Hypothetical predicted protein, partial [Paramuricea clavata]